VIGSYNNIDLRELGGVLIPESCEAIKFGGLHNVGHNYLNKSAMQMNTSNVETGQG
jgi:hypothetical protein